MRQVEFFYGRVKCVAVDVHNDLREVAAVL
jgi:hypothetical protein